MPSLAGSIFGLESIREVSDLYEGSEGIVQDPDGVFRCSVCGKKYKTRAGAKKHWEARDCWNVQDITRGTILEVRAYDLYLRVVKAFSPDDRRGASMPLASFRKNRGCYTNAAKTILFCDLNHVHDINEYLSWIFCTRDNIKTIWDLFGAAREQWILAEYRQDRHVCPTLFSSSREYVNQHRDRWEEAPEDLMREILNARISLGQLVEDCPEFLARLPKDYQQKLEELAEELAGASSAPVRFGKTQQKSADYVVIR